MPVTRMRGWRAMALAPASRSANGAIPATGFSGFCGDTSHQTSSSFRRFSAIRLIWRCPAWAGLNEPPSRPMARERASGCRPDSGGSGRGGSLQRRRLLKRPCFSSSPPLAGGGKGRGFAPAGAHESLIRTGDCLPRRFVAAVVSTRREAAALRRDVRRILCALPRADPSPFPLPQGEGNVPGEDALLRSNSLSCRRNTAAGRRDRQSRGGFSIPGPRQLAYDGTVAGVEASGESMNLRRILFVLFLAVFAAGMAPAHADTNVLFIFDSSGSMKKKVDNGEARMTVAKRAMTQALKDMPAGVRVGLLLYGHRKAKDCTDIELKSPIGADDPAAIAGIIGDLKPKGETPIAAALEQAIRS